MTIKEVIVLEILSHVMLMNAGKIKIISTLFYLRQFNTSVLGDTMIMGNNFLERCITNNAFSEFPFAVDRFLGLTNIEDRKEVLKSIDGWLNFFVFNNHRIHGHQGVDDLYSLLSLCICKSIRISELLKCRITITRITITMKQSSGNT